MAGVGDLAVARPRDAVGERPDHRRRRGAVLGAAHRQGRHRDPGGVVRQVGVADRRAGSGVGRGGGSHQHGAPGRQFVPAGQAEGRGEPALHHSVGQRFQPVPVDGGDPGLPHLRCADPGGGVAQHQGREPVTGCRAPTAGRPVHRSTARTPARAPCRRGAAGRRGRRPGRERRRLGCRARSGRARACHSAACGSGRRAGRAPGPRSGNRFPGSSRTPARARPRGLPGRSGRRDRRWSLPAWRIGSPLEAFWGMLDRDYGYVK